MEELDVSRETMEGSKLDIIVGYGEFLIGVGTENRICRSGDHEGGGLFHVKQCGQANPITARDRGASW